MKITYCKQAFIGLSVCFILLISSCQKQDDYLDVKGNNYDVIPSALRDYQALLNSDGIMNSSYPDLGYLCTDNLYLLSSTWSAAFLAMERNAYVWLPDLYEGNTFSEWNNLYRIIQYANIVLEGIGKISTENSNSLAKDQLKGSALFFRSMARYSLLQQFALPYDSATAQTDMGIPLKEEADIHATVIRNSVQECYERIIADLKTAAALLPVSVGFKTNPCKAAAYGLLARTLLHTGNYQQVYLYSDSALQLNNALMDFNGLNASTAYPFPAFTSQQPEVIFFARGNIYNTARLSYVDTTLYNSYQNNDLRKNLFFNKVSDQHGFRGSYSSSLYPFSGIATNEIYLIRSEAAARTGQISKAMNDLNTLLQKRWKTGTYIPMSALDETDALQKILTERRKELPVTGNIRWEDLRRLNRDTRFAKTITHIINGQTYTLAPNDKKYVLPIPDDEIRLSGIPQNIR